MKAQLVDFFYVYDTPRTVVVRDKKVGITSRLIQLGVLCYIIGMQTLEEFDTECPLTTSFCKLISTTEFDEQSVAYTEQALQELYKTMDQNPRLYERVVRKRKQRELEKASIASFIEAKFFSTVQGDLNRCNAMGSAELKLRIEQLKAEMQKVCSYSREAKCMRTSRSEQMKSGYSSPCSTPSSYKSYNSITHHTVPVEPCEPSALTFSLQPLTPSSFPATAPSEPLSVTSAGSSLPFTFTFSLVPSSLGNSVPSGSFSPALTASAVTVQVNSSSEPSTGSPISNQGLPNSPSATDACVLGPSFITTASVSASADSAPAIVTPGTPASHPGTMPPSHIPFIAPVPVPASVHPNQESPSSITTTAQSCISETSPLLASSSAPSTCHPDTVIPSVLALPHIHPDIKPPLSVLPPSHHDPGVPCTSFPDPVSVPSVCAPPPAITLPPPGLPPSHHDPGVPGTSFPDPVSVPSVCAPPPAITLPPPGLPPSHHDPGVPCTSFPDPVSVPSVCAPPPAITLPPPGLPPSHHDPGVPGTSFPDPVSVPSVCAPPPAITLPPPGLPPSHHDPGVPGTSFPDPVSVPSVCAPPPAITLPPPGLSPSHHDPGVPGASFPDPVSVPSVCVPPPAPFLPPSVLPLLFTPHRDQTISRKMFGVSTPDLLTSYGLGKLNSKSLLDQTPITPLSSCGKDTFSSLQSELQAGNHMNRLRRTGLVRSPGGTPVLDASTTNTPAVTFNTSLLNKFQNVNGTDTSDSDGENSGFETPSQTP